MISANVINRFDIMESTSLLFGEQV